MKNSSRFSLLIAAVLCMSFFLTTNAQDVKKDLEKYVKKYETAFNKKDDKTIKEMHTTNVVRTNPDGTTLNGSEAIREYYAAFFSANNGTIEIKMENAEKQADGTVLGSGSYHLVGTTNAGEKIDATGKFNNVFVKEKKNWKIAKAVVSN